jgi:uncharacterized protein (TIGR02597 family)
MKNHLSLIVGAVALAAAAGSYAQTATTDPVGYITINVRGSASGLSFIAPSLVNKVEFAGTISAITTTSITVSGNPFTADQFNGANGAFYVEITSGANAGAWTNITSTTTNSIGTADDMDVFANAGDTIKIRKHITVADFFGATNTAGFQSGDQIGVADEIRILNSETKAINKLFYYNDGVAQQWVTENFDDAFNIVIEPQQGLFVVRKNAAALSFVRVGHVKTGPTKLSVDTGLNIVAVPRAVGTAFTLGNSNLRTGSTATGVQAADNIAGADVIRISQPTGVLKNYFFYDDGVAQQWVDEDFNDATGVNLNEGTSFVLVRKPASSFPWTVPAETIAP